MLKSVLAYAALVSSVAPLGAFVEAEIDTSKALEVTFSKLQQNRIAVSPGRVSKLIAPEGIYSFNLESESGQAFVFPQEEYEGSLTISVVTDRGFVQDLAVSLSECPSEVVILREPEYTEEAMTNSSAQGSFDRVVGLIQSILRESIPDGFAVRGPEKLPERKHRVAKVYPRRLIIGPYETICVYEVENCRDRQIALTEAEFTLNGDSWLFLSSSSIAEGDSALLLVGVQK